jgi:hypothetical protein
MKLLLKLHGTSGSGKTTVARELMKLDPAPKTILSQTSRKPIAYEVHLPGCKEPLYVLGPYTATCGGLDGLSDVEDHIKLLDHYGKLGHVFYEGLLGSEYYGRIGKVSEQFGDNKPLNPSNTVGRVAKITRLRVRLETEFRRKTVLIHHDNAATEIYNLYTVHDAL